MKKTIMILLLATILCLIIVGCGQEEETDKGVLVYHQIEVGQSI